MRAIIHISNTFLGSNFFISIIGTNRFDSLPDNFGSNYNNLQVLSLRENLFSGDLITTMFNSQNLVIV